MLQRDGCGMGNWRMGEVREENHECGCRHVELEVPGHQVFSDFLFPEMTPLPISDKGNSS